MPRVSLRPGARLLRQEYVQLFTFVFLLLQLTCSSLGKSSRWSVCSNAKERETLSCLPYCLGKSHNDSESPLWRVLRLFWGEENTMKLKQTIFGPETLVAPNSRTNINQLYNMITLSSEIHGHWGLGNFMLEPVDEATNSYEQNLRFKWVPQRRSSGSINLLTNPNSLLDVLEAEPEMLFRNKN